MSRRIKLTRSNLPHLSALFQCRLRHALASSGLPLSAVKFKMPLPLGIQADTDPDELRNTIVPAQPAGSALLVARPVKTFGVGTWRLAMRQNALVGTNPG